MNRFEAFRRVVTGTGVALGSLSLGAGVAEARFDSLSKAAQLSDGPAVNSTPQVVEYVIDFGGQSTTSTTSSSEVPPTSEDTTTTSSIVEEDSTTSSTAPEAATSTSTPDSATTTSSSPETIPTVDDKTTPESSTTTTTIFVSGIDTPEFPVIPPILVYDINYGTDTPPAETVAPTTEVPNITTNDSTPTTVSEVKTLETPPEFLPSTGTKEIQLEAGIAATLSFFGFALRKLARRRPTVKA